MYTKNLVFNCTCCWHHFTKNCHCSS